jgi:hypothetical protein
MQLLDELRLQRKVVEQSTMRSHFGLKPSPALLLLVELTLIEDMLKAEALRRTLEEKAKPRKKSSDAVCQTTRRAGAKICFSGLANGEKKRSS